MLKWAVEVTETQLNEDEEYLQEDEEELILEEAPAVSNESYGDSEVDTISMLRDN